METLIEIIRAIAPWLPILIGLCLIVLVVNMMLARAAALKAADNEFGNWPDKAPFKKTQNLPNTRRFNSAAPLGRRRIAGVTRPRRQHPCRRGPFLAFPEGVLMKSVDPAVGYTGRERKFLGFLWTQYEYRTRVYVGRKWQNPKNINEWPLGYFWTSTPPLDPAQITANYVSRMNGAAEHATNVGMPDKAKDIRAVINATKNCADLRLKDRG
ncbi:hypothetical protein [uncultured Roseibium sp.]|uniref:hypothetical protein n=1 Tax=uncultured Roseibium sp. TaxID=1936171 RepID=UPI00260BCF1D|nr:hypothetical protein [uncultured Roseibium sp.]